MSDSEETKPFAAELAATGRAVCKKCKQKCAKGELRLAKIGPNPFGEGLLKSWHHVNCLFEQFLKQRQNTKRIESSDDIEGWDLLQKEAQDSLLEKIEEGNKSFEDRFGVKVTRKPKTPKKEAPSTSQSPGKAPKSPGPVPGSSSDSKKIKTEGSSFREFRKLVAEITSVSSYLEKTKIVHAKLFGNNDEHRGDIILWCKLLLPGVVKRIYNLQSKQLIKLFSRLFNCDQNKMLKDLEKGDVAETIATFFQDSRSSSAKPASKSLLTLEEVDEFLEELAKLTKEDEQSNHFISIIKKCTANDLKIIIRLIKHDLRMNAGAKHILDGVHPDAYKAYQSSRNIEAVINRCLGPNQVSKTSSVKATISLMTPVLPMLAEACKSVQQAMTKCPNGMYSEIKYDGERVQVHKQGSEFRYFSRSLKPVLPHKVAHFKEFIPKAFPHGKDLILDSEILMIDSITGKPLPFGTLGVHKKSEFKDANVCLFVFDCIYYNGEILTHKPIKDRKTILEEVMTEIPNHIVFSEKKEIHQPNDLAEMIAKVLKLGLEGLVLKDLMSVYEPGKRHWLKVKKDYLFGGAMADSADLIVLGAWYGTGKKGGMMSVFLMGCHDPVSDKFCTVTKVHTGHDDETLERLQEDLKMVQISGSGNAVNRVPDWLHCTKTMVPDFVAEDPRKQPVWEITGAEFTQHEVHTADGISIRFPRVTRIRDDKTWETATSLQELQQLVRASKDNIDVSLLLNNDGSGSGSGSSKKNSLVKKEKQTNLDDFAKRSPVKRRRSSSGSDSETEPSTSAGKKKINYASSSSVKILNPIPDYFFNVNLLLDKGCEEEYKDWIRYFIAYGGTVVRNEEAEKATHVLHLKDSVKKFIECPKSAKHVTVNWIRQSIAKKKMVDTKFYTVTLRI